MWPLHLLNKKKKSILPLKLDYDLVPYTSASITILFMENVTESLE
jgi:hypothetical protein